MNFHIVLRQVRRLALGGALAGLAYGALKVLRTGGSAGREPSYRDDERFGLYADNARDFIYRYRFRPTQGFEYVSPSSTAITGYSPEEHYADPNLDLRRVHPEDRHLLEGSARYPEKPLVLRWYRNDGALIWTEQRNKPIYDGAGNV
ncbi:MAG TPA: PAS domain-containing protein, partial [Rubrobacter sp.]|nr:PAS domain-containing protein [Rubrobacter sp.]